MIGAERDEVIPIRHAQALYEALPMHKRMWIVKGAGHNDWSLVIPQAGWEEVTDFLRSGAGNNQAE